MCILISLFISQNLTHDKNMDVLLKHAAQTVDEALNFIKKTYKKRAEEIRAEQDANGPLALLIFPGEGNDDRGFCLEAVQVKKELLDPLVEFGSFFSLEGHGIEENQLMDAAMKEIFVRVYETPDRNPYGKFEWDFQSAVAEQKKHEEEEEEESDQEASEEEDEEEAKEDGTAAKKRRVDLDLRDPLNPTEPKLNVIRTITGANLFKSIRPEDLARVVVSDTMFINLAL